MRTIVLISNDLSDGMTQCQQEEVIAKFRSGAINLLVSTTVGEEGIDLPDCKYVIKYDVVGNEIASVQSRGRVRHKEGKYEVVAGKESGVIEKESLNVIREVMMQEAIKEVKAMAQKEYADKVRVHKKETQYMQKKMKYLNGILFITPSEQLPYLAYVTAFTQTGLYLDTFRTVFLVCIGFVYRYVGLS